MGRVGITENGRKNIIKEAGVQAEKKTFLGIWCKFGAQKHTGSKWDLFNPTGGRRCKGQTRQRKMHPNDGTGMSRPDVVKG